MGMGSAPCHAWTISLLGLKAISPRETDACERAFQALGYDWDAFAQGMTREEFDDLPEGAGPEDMVNRWQELQAAFSSATQVGTSCLELGIGHYSPDEGDRYDELDEGCYFTVGGAACLTPAGEKFKEHLAEKSWTVFG